MEDEKKRRGWVGRTEWRLERVLEELVKKESEEEVERN